MAVAKLSIDLGAIVANWRTLDAMSAGETSAVVKANAYGLGVDRVVPSLTKAGVQTFFVAAAEEGFAVRKAAGNEARVFVFSGHMDGDARALRDNALIPLLNSPHQWQRHCSELPDHPFGIQLDTGMNRLGMEPRDFATLREDIQAASPVLVMSHLACSDEPEHIQNVQQLSVFKSITEGIDAAKSLAATGGTLLGENYHFDLCRPGVGLYGGEPFAAANPVVTLETPIIQTRDVTVGESVGYGATWVATRPSKIATIAAGYADGLIRAMGNGLSLWADDQPCPLVGRVSMDMMGVDVTDLTTIPTHLDILNATQTVDVVAEAAGTIGYEILTSLGARYDRHYIGG